MLGGEPQNEQDSGMISLSATWWRTLLMIVVIGALAYAGYILFERYLRPAATILLLAGLLTFLLQPPVTWLVRLCRLRDTHATRIGAVLLIFLLLGTGLYSFGAGVAHALGHDLQDLKASWDHFQTHRELPLQIQRLQHWYVTNVPIQVQEKLASSFQQEMAQFSEKYIPGMFLWLGGFALKASKLLGLLIELIFVPLIAFYFLTDAPRVREQMLYFVPRRRRAIVEHYATGINSILRRYVYSQLLLCVIAWVVVSIGLLLMGVKGALLLGVAAGASRAIPVLGPVIGGIPVLAAVALDAHLAGTFWWVLLGFSSLHLFESKFLMPRILGDHLGVHPVVVILSLLVGYEMLGLLGMFLAPPAVAVVRYVLAIHRGEIPAPAPVDAPLPATAGE